MLHSALNFAIGFFGLPIEGQYQQSVTIESHGVSFPRSVTSSQYIHFCALLVQQYFGSLHNVSCAFAVRVRH